MALFAAAETDVVLHAVCALLFGQLVEDRGRRGRGTERIRVNLDIWW